MPRKKVLPPSHNPMARNLTDDQIDELVNKARSQRLKDNAPVGTGQGILRSFASPFLKTAATGIKIGKGAYNGAQALGDLALGDKAGFNRNIQEGNDAMAPKPIDFGYFGKVNPLGANSSKTFLPTGGDLKETIGTGLELGSYALGGEGLVSGASNLLKRPITSTLARGALTGLETGFTGGLGHGLGERESLLGAAGEGAIGGAGGAVGGVLLSGAGSLLGKTAARVFEGADSKIARETEKLVDTIAPKLDKKASIEALTEAGKPGGAIQEGGKFIKTPSRNDLEMAEAVRGVVNPKANPIQNITNLNKEISTVGQAMEENLSRTPGIFNNNQIASKLRDVELPLSIKADPVLERQHNLITEKFMQILGSKDEAGNAIYPNTKLGLWKARQAFDDFLDKELKGALFDPSKNAAYKDAAMSVRTVVNDAIKEGLPEGSPFSEMLKREALMYRARMNIAEKNWNKLGTNALQRFMQKYPKSSAAAIGALPLGALGALGYDALKNK